LGRLFFVFLTSFTILTLELMFNSSVNAQAPAGDRTGGALVGLPSGVPPSILRGGSTGELMSVYNPRSKEEIQRQLELAKSAQQSAENSYAESVRRAQSASGQLQIMTEEQRTTQTRLSVARKEKNSSNVSSLTSEAKRQEAERKYLVSLRDATAADMASLDSQRVAAAAQVKALQIESDAAKKHDEIISANSEKAADTAGYATLLKQMFSAQKEGADRALEAASKQNALASRKLKQLDALSKLSK
jgi:hypothetical protein